MSSVEFGPDHPIGDPYQGSFGPYSHDDWFRHQFESVKARGECLQCEGSVPWSDDYGWKYAAAGGVVVGPFCSPKCHWTWLGWSE